MRRVNVPHVTHFFATHDETQAWVDAEAARLRLVVEEDWLPGGTRRCFLWPREAPSSPGMKVVGVMVDFPAMYEGALTIGVTGWKAPAFQEPIASVGRRLTQQLSRSLRKMATIPLYAVSYDGSSRDDKPSAWGTPTAVSAGVTLRQRRGGAVTFTP